MEAGEIWLKIDEDRHMGTVIMMGGFLNRQCRLNSAKVKSQKKVKKAGIEQWFLSFIQHTVLQDWVKSIHIFNLVQKINANLNTQQSVRYESNVFHSWLLANKHLKTFHFCRSLIPLFSSWFCNHRPGGSNVILKNLTDPKADTLHSDLRGQGSGWRLCPATDHIWFKGRAGLWFMCEFCTDNYSHPIDKSTSGQDGVICVCARVSWRGKTLGAEENLTQTSSDVGAAGVRLCHMLALSVHMRPTCAEWAESGILWWVKGSRVMCQLLQRGLKEGETCSTFALL